MLSRWTAVIQAIELRWSFLGLNPKTNRIPETVMGKTPPEIFWPEVGYWLLSPCPRYAGEIWKRRFHSENASDVFRPHYADEIWKRSNHRPFWISVWGKRRQGKHVIIVMRSFSKGSIFQTFSVDATTSSRRFQIPPRFRDGLVWTVGLTIEIKLVFKISPA